MDTNKNGEVVADEEIVRGEDTVLVSEPEEVPAPVIEDRHTSEDPLTIDKEPKTKISKQALPSGDWTKLQEFAEVITRLIQNNAIGGYDEKTSQNIMHSSYAKKNYSPDGTFENTLRNDDWVNNINYSDKQLNIRKVPFGNSKDPEVLKAKFTSALGLGDVVQVPLYHSGFWITIRPPKDNDLLSLHHSINKEIINLGRSTNTMIHSNYSVIYNRLVTDFVLDHTLNSTLAVDVNKLKPYISTNDIETLVLGIIASLYPDGYNYSRNCRNILEFKETGEPKCIDYITGKISPMKTLFVNRKILSNNALLHMAKRSPNSVSIDEVTEYKLSISKLNERTSVITGSNNKVFELTYKIPDVETYTHKGQAWVDQIIVLAEELFSDTESDEGKNRKVNEMMYTMVLGVYGSYIKSIKIKDSDIEIENYLDILDTLHTLSSDSSVVNTIVDEVKKYINDTAIAVVAIPNYTCAGCKEEQLLKEEVVNEDFVELIPLNLLESFFDLCVMRLAR